MPLNGPPRLRPGSYNVCGNGRMSMSSIDLFSIPMSRLIEILSGAVSRMVVDKTGFTAKFDVHLEFDPDTAGVNGVGQAQLRDAGATPSAELSRPSIFTALQEQLGLRLESAKGPVEVLVIDHVERPSAN